MSLVYIQTQTFIFCCSPVQDRMVGANSGVYNFVSEVKGLHIIKKLYGLHALIDEMLQVYCAGRYK